MIKKEKLGRSEALYDSGYLDRPLSQKGIEIFICNQELPEDKLQLRVRTKAD